MNKPADQENTRILTAGVNASNSPYGNINTMDLVIGSPGSGKTRSYVLPNLLQNALLKNESVVIADTKGQLRHQVGDLLARRGYKVIDIDFADMVKSRVGYNPFQNIRFDHEAGEYNWKDIESISYSLVPNTSVREPYWDSAGRQFLSFIVEYMMNTLPIEECTFQAVFTILSTMIGENEIFSTLMNEYGLAHPHSTLLTRYRTAKVLSGAERAFASVLGVLTTAIDPFSTNGAVRFARLRDRVHFADIGNELTAVFLKISDSDRSNDRLVSTFYTQMLQTLLDSADHQENGRLPVPVRIYLDDFASNVRIKDFANLTSIIRSRDITCSIICQTVTQLDSLYGAADASTITSNCDHILYLGGNDFHTCEMVARQADVLDSTIMHMPIGSVMLMTRGQKAVIARLYDPVSHPLYAEIKERRLSCQTRSDISNEPSGLSEREDTQIQNSMIR